MTVKCRTVLVVEDDELIRDVLQTALELEGYQVVTAENGQDAIKLLKNIQHPCLILLDLMMPIMNGWEFLEFRKSDDVLMTIPVAVVTAATDHNIRSAGEVQAVIKKPIDLTVLLRWVQHCCNNLSNQIEIGANRTVGESKK